MFKLFPLSETAAVDKNGNLGVAFKYSIKHTVGNTITNIKADSTHFIRFRPSTSTNSTNLSINTLYPTYTNASFMTNYFSMATKPTYFVIELVNGTTVLDTRLTPIILLPSAAFEIKQATDTEVASIKSRVTANETKIENNARTITNNYSTLTQKANEIESTVGSVKTVVDNTSTERRNLISGSYLRMVSKVYGAKPFVVDIVKDTTYTFSVNGMCQQALLDSGGVLNVYLHSSNGTTQLESLTIDSATPTTKSITFTAKYSGKLHINFYI